MNDTASTESPGNKEAIHTFEIVLSTLLRIGVVASLLIVITGIVLAFIHHPEYLHSHAILQSLISRDHPAWQTLMGILTGLGQFRGEAIIMLGLLLLIATPVLRVAVSIIAFGIEKDWVFVLLTSFVLAMLILSFALGKAGG